MFDVTKDQKENTQKSNKIENIIVYKKLNKRYSQNEQK